MQQQVVEFLAGIRDGLFLADVYAALTAAVEAQAETHKRAEVRIAISLAPISPGDDVPVAVTATVTTRLPQRQVASTIFYPSHDGAVLSRRDPRQMDLFALKTVGGSEEPGAEDVRYADHG